MTQTKVVNRIGPGFLGLLTLLFVAAKLFGAVTWSWWLVFAPLWVPFVFWLGLAVIAGVVAWSLSR